MNLHLAPAASTKPLLQGSAVAGTAVYSPDAVKLDNVTEEPLAFVSCTTGDVLVVPITVPPKFKLAGVKVKGLLVGPPVALPERSTDCGL